MAGYMHDQVQAMVAQVKTLTVEKLKTLLRTEGLPVSGVKSELQIRTIARTAPPERYFTSASTQPDIDLGQTSKKCAMRAIRPL